MHHALRFAQQTHVSDEGTAAINARALAATVLLEIQDMIQDTHSSQSPTSNLGPFPHHKRSIVADTEVIKHTQT